MNELLGSVVERRDDAARDPGGFGRVVRVEHGTAWKPPKVGIRVAGADSLMVIDRTQFDAEWVVLPSIAVRSGARGRGALSAGRVRSRP